MLRNDKDLKDKIANIIFETDTPAGKAFDVLLVISIISNSILIIIESVESFRISFGPWFILLGWFFLFIFTIEYLLRLIVVKNRVAYFFSFYGIIDLLAILPVFLGAIIPQVRFLIVIRTLRLLRLFSIFKMGRYIDESSHLIRALKASRPKITVFLFAILIIVILVGSLMYIIEGPEHGFRNIPESMYWAVVTVSTVGYGDISPQTPVGKFISSLLMIVAYGIIAVPTGIISHELAKAPMDEKRIKTCTKCNKKYYDDDDLFCSKCGTSL